MEEERIRPYVPTVNYWLLGTNPERRSFADLEPQDAPALMAFDVEPVGRLEQPVRLADVADHPDLRDLAGEER